MRSMLRLALATALLVGAVGLVVWAIRDEQHGVETVTPDVLTVATDFPAPGFWEGSDVRHVSGGFEADLAVELADRLGLDRVEVVERRFDDLVDGRAGGFDVALAQVSITRERAAVVDLSRPYLTTPVGVVGRAGDDTVPDLADARTLRWAVQEATTEVDVVDDLIRPDDDATVYPTVAAALSAVARQVVDVAAIDFVRALAEVDEPPDLALAAQVTAPQNVGALLPEGSDNLSAVDAALRSLEADGTLDDLRDELFDRYDTDLSDLPTIRVTP